jgi:predicted amidohydrolase
MTLEDVIRATTATPALAIGRAASAGTLTAGSVADLSVFELRSGHWALPDASGHTETVEQLLVPQLVIRAGQVCAIEPPAAGLQAAGSGP